MKKFSKTKKALSLVVCVAVLLSMVLPMSVFAAEPYYYDDGFDTGTIVADRWSGNYAPDRITYSYDSTEGGLVYTGTATAANNYAWIDFDLDSVKTAGKYNIDVTYSFNGARPDSGEYDFLYLLSSTTALPTDYQAKMSLDGWATPYIRTITSDCKGCELDKNFAAFNGGNHRFRENTSSGVTTFIDEKITTRIYVDLDNDYVTFANKIEGVDTDFVPACHKTSDGSSYETGHAAQFPITALQTIRFSGQCMSEGGTIAIHDVTVEESIPQPYYYDDGFDTGAIAKDRWSGNYAPDRITYSYDSTEGGLVYTGTANAATNYAWIDFDLDSVKTAGKYSIDVTYSFNGSRPDSGDYDFIYLLSSTTDMPTTYQAKMSLDGWATPLIKTITSDCKGCEVDKNFAAFGEGSYRFRENTSGGVTTFIDEKITTRIYVDLDNEYVTFANKIEGVDTDFVPACHKTSDGSSYETGHAAQFPITALQTVRFSGQCMTEGGTIAIHDVTVEENLILPESEVSIVVKKDGQVIEDLPADTNVTVEATYTNGYEAAQNVALIVALYDSKGCLYKVTSGDLSLGLGLSDTVTATWKTPASGTSTIKAFVWTSDGRIIPVEDATDFPKQ